MTKKIITPANEMIYKQAAEFAAIYYDAGRSSGLHSKYKTPKAFARANIEKFLPMVIKTYLEMLKPTSNCTEEMRAMIYEALMDPVNDPSLMTTKVDIDINQQRLDDIIKNYDKNQLKFKDLKLIPKTKQNYKNKLLNTANPLTPKPN